MLAYEWQLMVITKKAGLCKDMPADELKKITMATGIVSEFALCLENSVLFLSMWSVSVRCQISELLTDKLSINPVIVND